MVSIPSSFRNLTQVVTNVSPQLAATVDHITHHAAPTSNASRQAVDALSELLAGTALSGGEPTGPRTESVEPNGHPDLLAGLWALVDRPVGKAVKRTTQTQSVQRAAGEVTGAVETAEYVNRPLTPEEILYLQRHGRLRNRPTLGELDYLNRQERR